MTALTVDTATYLYNELGIILIKNAKWFDKGKIK